ncbi:hypothetical protein ZWY2020_011388 [Hordeum vulgare]|nr:hypothetical protein ZWY2020_011388 [Hordeum vulgare]
MLTSSVSVHGIGSCPRRRGRGRAGRRQRCHPPLPQRGHRPLLRRRVPLLQNHVLVSASDGLLVLGEKKYPHRASVLNPLTGSLVRFAAATIPRVNRVRAAVTGSEGDPSLSLVFSFFHDPYSDAVSCAHPTGGEISPVQQLPHPGAGPFLCSKQASMATYRGHVYVADRDGQIVRFVVMLAQQHHCHAELMGKAPSESVTGGRCGRAFLVASDGELLLVRLYHLRRRRAVEVYRVDAERKAPLEHGRSLGRRALFLGDRSLSFNAGELPSVDGDCVYLASENGDVAWRYDLRDGSESRISSFDARPFGLVQVLLNFCVVLPDAKAQLHSVYRNVARDSLFRD